MVQCTQQIKTILDDISAYVAMEIFFNEGERSKIFLGGDGVGDPNVRSTIRERNFFLFFF